MGFFPFKTAGDALANINSVSEGIVHDDLKLFLDTNLPKVSEIVNHSLQKADPIIILSSHVSLVLITCETNSPLIPGVQ